MVRSQLFFKTLVEGIGGSVTVRSRPGEGSIFTITSLPTYELMAVLFWWLKMKPSAFVELELSYEGYDEAAL